MLWVLLLVLSGARTVHADDTLACLYRDGPVLRVVGDQGYQSYSNRAAADATVFDLRGATWKTEQVPRYLNNYPIRLGGAENGCVIGGVVIGTTRRTADWRERYGQSGPTGGNSAAIFAEGVARFTYSGMRATNVWDGVRVNRQSGHFTIKNNWIDAVDDCIENDALLSGVIDDNLFDGCFVFVSSRAGRLRPLGTGTAATELVTISNNLVYMKAIPRDGGFEEGNLLKISGLAGGPQFALHDNLFLHYGIKTREKDGTLAKLVSTPAGKIHSCSGNVMLWLGKGPFPGVWPNDRFPGCLTVLTGQAAEAYWTARRLDWIDCHPHTDRSASERPSDPALCGTRSGVK